MLPHRPTHSATYDPRQLHILGQVFDAAWVRIAPAISIRSSSADAARTKLAKIVLQVAQDGVSTPDEMTRKVLNVAFAEPPELHHHSDMRLWG
jgi:hypothetical protein